MACDKTPRFPRIVLLLVLSLLCAAAPLGAQERQYVPITRENAPEIVQLSRTGNGAVRALALSNTETELAIATTLGVWVVKLDDDASEPVLHEGQGGASSASFNPDAALIAGGGDDGSVMVWDTASGEVVTRLENHLYPVSAVAWSSDGSLLASGDWSGIVRVWDVATWGEYRVFPTTEKIERLSFDGDTLTALSLDLEFRWLVADNALLSQEERTTDLGNSTEVSVGERRAILDSYHCVIDVWDKGEPIIALEDFCTQLGGAFFTEEGQVGVSRLTRASLTSQILSPDQSILATFGNDGIIRLLDAASGDQIAALYGHIRKINAVAFSPDGSLLVSASDDGTLQFWDATVTEDSASLVTLEGHTSGVTSVAFNANGTLIASTGYDGTVRTWGIPQ